MSIIGRNVVLVECMHRTVWAGDVPHHSTDVRLADQSCPSTAKIKNVWHYTFTPPMYLNGVVPCYSLCAGK
jgi:hypothetical protein